VLDKSPVQVGGGDHVSVLIRDRLEEAGQGQEAASSEEASSLVVSNPDFLGRGAPSVTSCSPIGSWPEPTTRGRTRRSLVIGLNTWLRHLILWSSTSFLKTRYDKVMHASSGGGSIMKRSCFRTG
jgi:hypothetical protein